MDTPADMYEQILQQIFDSTDTDEILEILGILISSPESANLSFKQRYALQARAFFVLKDMTTQDLLPPKRSFLTTFCHNASSKTKQLVIEISQHRECLVDWVDQYDENIRFALRNEVLAKITLHLQSRDTIPACKLISRIGYRDERIVNELWRILETNENEAGDWAISTLVGLGIPDDKDKGRILSKVHTRASRRRNTPLTIALTQLADPSSLEVISTSSFWLPACLTSSKSVAISQILNIPFHMLDTRSEDSQLQDRTWNWFIHLVQENPDLFSNRNCF